MIRLTKLTLDLAKNESFNLTELKLRQFDTGYALVFALTDSWREVKVDATNIGFRAVKPDKTIIDVKGTGVSKDADGYWVFKIPKEFTQLASPVQRAHIYVQDKDNIYTSSDITFYIEPQFGENSGVSAESIEEIKRLLETAHALNFDLQRIQNNIQNEVNSKITDWQNQLSTFLQTVQTNCNNLDNEISNIKAKANALENNNDILNLKDSVDSLKTYFESTKYYKLQLKNTEVNFKIKAQQGFIKATKDQKGKLRLDGEIPISFTIDKEPEEWSKEGVIKRLIAKFTLVNIYDSSDYLTVPQDFNLEVPVLTTLKSGEKSDYATPMKILFNKEAVGELPLITATLDTQGYLPTSTTCLTSVKINY